MRISDWSSDMCSSDLRHLRRVHPGDYTAQNCNAGRRDAGHAADQYAASALFLFQIMRADLNRHTPGHLGPGFQQRPAAARCRSGLTEYGSAPCGGSVVRDELLSDDDVLLKKNK